MIEHSSTPHEPSESEVADAAWAALAADGRARARRRPTARELAVDLGLLAAFVAAAALLLGLEGLGDDVPWVDAAALAVAYALASKIELDVGSGYTVPTEVVLVVALLVLPPALVPVLVVVALVAPEVPVVLRGRLHPLRMLIGGGDAIHALAPAAVLAVADLDGVALEHWPIYVAALAAQFGLDLVVTLTREWLRVGVPPGAFLLELRFVYLLDAVLAPLGLCAALAAQRTDHAYLLVLPVLIFARMLAKERTRRMEGQVALAEVTVAAHTDALTGTLNRRGWDEHLERLLPSPAPAVTIALLDVDGLKEVNDTQGHAAGDALLTGAAVGWRRVLRPEDVLARTGGDEFAVSFVARTERDVESICARLRTSLPNGHTCSIGVAAAMADETAHALEERADARLYADKRRGD